jgi:hypothetical protein
MVFIKLPFDLMNLYCTYSLLKGSSTWENVCSKVTFIFVSHGACVGVLDHQTY